jgi:two-component system sensor kinase FixL
MLARFRERVKPGAAGPVPYFIAAGLVLFCFLFRLAIAPWIGQRTPLLPFIPGIVLAAGLYGIGPGVLAIVLSLIAGVLAFIVPATPFGPVEAVNVAVFLVVSGAMLTFANHLRRARRTAEFLQIELQHAETAAAMSTMAATLAHELNQPLTAASNYLAACQYLASGVAEPKQKPLSDGLGRAHAQIQRAGSIIRHARALVGNRSLERGPSSLRQMINRAIELIRAAGDGDVRVHIDIAPDSDLLAVNAIQIEQVLLNLFRNACEVMRGASRRDLWIKARATARGGLIEIRDNGPGIPRDRLATLFSPGRSGKPTGMGIGLSICRTIIEAHHGKIWAQNNPEGGASFFILLPSDFSR